MRKTRKRQLFAVYRLVTAIRPHKGVFSRYVGFQPSRERQLKKAFSRARRRGVPALRAMTDAVLDRQ